MWLLLPALLTLHVAVCFLLVLIVLMQLPRSEGLGAAFGGAVTENIFGAQTTHVLARFTVWFGVAFFALTLLLAVAYSRKNSAKASKVQQELLNAPLPITAPAASGPPAAEAALAAPAPSPATVPSATPAPAAP